MSLLTNSAIGASRCSRLSVMTDRVVRTAFRSTSFEPQTNFQSGRISVGASDRASAGLDTGLHNRQSQTDPARFPAARVIHSEKWIEDPLQKLFRNSRAVIAYFQLNKVALAAAGNDYRPFSFGIAHSVANQVRQRSLKQIRIGN